MAALYRTRRTHFLVFKVTITTTKLLIVQLNQSASLTRLLRPICTNSHNFLRPEHFNTVDTLISIFTKHPIASENQQLLDLGSKLTPKIVESVLKSLRSWRISQIFFDWASNQQGYNHNCYTFNAMAEILSRARQNDQLRILAGKLVKSGCYMSPGALGFFLRCLGNQGLVKEANMLFDQLKMLGLCIPNKYTYGCLLEVISKSSDVALIELRLTEMHDYGWVLDKYALTPVLHCYCNAGKFENALNIFNQMHEKGWVDAHVLSILMVSFTKWGEVGSAFELIERTEELNINIGEKTFCVLIHGFVKAGKMDKALLLLDKMRNLGFSPDIAIYGALIGGLCRNKETEKALQLFRVMNESGLNPDVKIISELLSCVPEESDMIQLLKIQNLKLDLKAKILIYNSVLKGLINKGSTDKAYHLLRATMGMEYDSDFYDDKLFLMKETFHPDTVSFETIIDGLCKSDKLDMALVLFRDMDQFGCKRSVLLYNTLIDCLSSLDRLGECRRLLIEMNESGFKPTHFTYNSIFRCLCRQGDVEQALGMVREMRVNGHEPWIKNYTLLIKTLCQDGKAVISCNFLAEMVREGFLPDVVAYSAAIDGLLKIQQMDKAMELFREICVRGYCPDVVAYNVIVKGLCKTERVMEAQDLLNEMLDKGLVPSVVTYNLLIDGWCKSGYIDQAILIFSRMVENEQEPNVITYTTLIDGLCNAGKPDDAMKLWVEMESKRCFPNRISFMAIINGLCKCSKPDDALVYLHEMEEKDMEPDVFIYIVLINAFISKSNPSAAYSLLGRMVQKDIFPGLSDKYHSVLKDAILTMFTDPRTSSDKPLHKPEQIPVPFLEAGECSKNEEDILQIQGVLESAPRTRSPNSGRGKIALLLRESVMIAFHKKAKTTKKIVLRLQRRRGCKHVSQHAIERCKHFENGGDKKGKETSLF
nr:putative pentatricopeptide repeat-containing protein At5g08310, mitochondrial [Ipomoea batatas]GMC93192.1 putative pentatricopeptide repeat-containing protein At5g08310, mitochondrial [Ipomoea batatas]GME01543.1 putative pentatricopeptide repeat-containing protein At5g08310, mitochondrial [Ipomoea batatas]